MRRAAYLVVMLALVVLMAGCGNCPVCRALGIGGGQKAETAAITQKTCPVMGGKIDPNVYTDYNGRRVYFCCPACDKTFKKDPAKYLAKLDSQGK